MTILCFRKKVPFFSPLFFLSFTSNFTIYLKPNMARVPWMRGIPGHPYSQRVVRRAKYLLAMKKKFPRCKNLTYAAITKQCGVLTKKTIRDWDYKIMTETWRNRECKERDTNDCWQPKKRKLQLVSLCSGLLIASTLRHRSFAHSFPRSLALVLSTHGCAIGPREMIYHGDGHSDGHTGFHFVRNKKF